ncbi:MAG TPA: DUF1501 domain-containing protein [Planctomycetaceae bacterium]|nr:DUF1501 domain-containing protein [Planctomycetaceae bacterium]
MRPTPNTPPPPPHHESTNSRRDFLLRSGAGFGGLALGALMASESGAAESMVARSGHNRTPARSVIFLFMDGGPSHIDTFDPKPEVNRLAGKSLPESIERVITPMGVSENPLLPTRRRWQRYGESGLPVSDWYPNVGRHADKLCVIRSCRADGLNHVGSVCQMNTGSILAGRPSLGAWVAYGLGSASRNLPGFVVLLDNDREPPGGTRVWGTGFMPATFQGTRFRQDGTPILHLAPPKSIGPRRQRGKLDFLSRLNRRHLAARRGDDELEARIAAYELAFRMQSHAPEAVDIAQETAATRSLYGLDDKTTAPFGRNCLMARRLVERGVRFIQLYSGSGSKWDAHSKIEQNHTARCRETDVPVAGLLADLEQRGLLDETLVIWGGEFGRTPMSEKGDGRDHNPYGFTMWMAGGGVRGGQVIGSTDDFGMHAVDSPAHVHDLHATFLHAIGLDHQKLVYHLQGRPERATVNEGEVIAGVMA